MVKQKIMNALQDMISIENDDECVDIQINIRKADGSKNNEGADMERRTHGVRRG